VRILLAHILFFATSCLYTLEAQQDISGAWRMVDDKGSEIALVKILSKNGVYRARVNSFGPASRITVCNACSGNKRGRSLLDIDIFWDLQLQNGEYDNGVILDPESGKEYALTVDPKGDRLEVRGYIGVPLFGQSQYWIRAQD
jgi:uncharacterized protein (DUF2147 family)